MGVPVGGVTLKLYRSSLLIFKDAEWKLLNFGFFFVGPIIPLPLLVEVRLWGAGL